MAAAPDSAPLHALLAHAELESGDTLTAMGELRRAAELDTTDADPWFQLGVLRAARFDLDGAREALSRAARLAGDEPAIEQALGLVAQQAGDSAEALRHFRRAAELSPDSPAARIDRAEALAAGGDRAEARVNRAGGLGRHLLRDDGAEERLKGIGRRAAVEPARTDALDERRQRGVDDTEVLPRASYVESHGRDCATMLSAHRHERIFRWRSRAARAIS